MRFLHTADWHLGRLFYQASLIEDQVHLLEQVVRLVEQVKPDALLVAGDVYDRAVPPREAVALLDDIVSRIVLGLKTPVVMIAGNHDSPDRLGFGNRLMAAERFFVAADLDRSAAPIPFATSGGPAAVFALPFHDPARVREVLEDDSLHTHDEATAAMLQQMRTRDVAGMPTVLLAHAFVTGGSTSESERPLAIGGAGTVSAPRFAGFDYVALGHLHRPQRIAETALWYSGSLFKYSFDESSQTKCVNLVEMEFGKEPRVERIPLSPRRDVRKIEGEFHSILASASADPNKDDYILFRLTDTKALFEPMAKLREWYPNALHIDRTEFFEAGMAKSRSRETRSDFENFDAFFEEVTGQRLAGEESRLLLRELERPQAENVS